MDDLKFLLSRYNLVDDDDDYSLHLNNLVSAAVAGQILAAAAGGNNDASVGHIASKLAQENHLGAAAPTSLPNENSGAAQTHLGPAIPSPSTTDSLSTMSQPTPSDLASSATSAAITSSPTASPTPSSAQTPSPFSSSADINTTASSTSASSTGSALADVSGGANPIKSFMDNKPLAISVITVSSVAGLALIILLLTCLVRRRRRNKVLNEVAQIPDDQVMGPPPIMNIEKTSPKGSPQVGHYGAMSRSGSLRRASSSSGPEMYQHSTAPVFVPADTINIQSAHPQLSPGQRHSFYQEQGSNSTGYRPESPSRVPDRPPQIPNPFDDSNAVPPHVARLDLSFAAAPAAAGIAGIGSVARASPVHRKPPPHLSLDLESVSSQSHMVHKSEGSPQSIVSHDGSPLQHGNTVNTGRPVVEETNVASAESVLTYVSLTTPKVHPLTSPKTAGPVGASSASGSEKRLSLDGLKRSASVESRTVEREAPPFPVPMISPLNFPDDHDLSPKLAPGDKGKKPMRTLKVVNA